MPETAPVRFKIAKINGIRVYDVQIDDIGLPSSVIHYRIYAGGNLFSVPSVVRVNQNNPDDIIISADARPTALPSFQVTDSQADGIVHRFADAFVNGERVRDLVVYTRRNMQIMLVSYERDAFSGPPQLRHTRTVVHSRDVGNITVSTGNVQHGLLELSFDQNRAGGTRHANLRDAAAYTLPEDDDDLLFEEALKRMREPEQKLDNNSVPKHDVLNTQRAFSMDD